MSPKTKAQYKEIRQQSKAAIMEAALELFATKGFSSTSISQIAQAAGISKGLMYNYFESKEQLLHEIIKGAFEEADGLMMQTMAQLIDPKAQLLAIVEGTFQMVRSHEHYWKLLTSLSFQPEISKEIDWIHIHKWEDTLAAFKTLLGQLGVEDTEKEALLMGATLDGIMLHYFFTGEKYPLDEMKTMFINRFCNY
ncbi:MAG: TetR/AcrR family transcriptional regulator [Saprospirales bacterium]|nr:TetR/AcrR family transcriptional regulator [Saprospirales bacterium]